jgi:hypothetical protein
LQINVAVQFKYLILWFFITQQKHQSKKLEMALQKSYNALHVCDGQLAILKAESEAAVNFLDKWQKVAEE